MDSTFRLVRGGADVENHTARGGLAGNRGGMVSAEHGAIARPAWAISDVDVAVGLRGSGTMPANILGGNGGRAVVDQNFIVQGGFGGCGGLAAVTGTCTPQSPSQNGGQGNNFGGGGGGGGIVGAAVGTGGHGADGRIRMSYRGTNLMECGP
jgi:hypothetical protein